MHLIEPPSSWVTAHTARIAAGGSVLDLACGSGRHACWLAEQGFRVEAVDRDASAMQPMAEITGIRCTAADLENAAWPYTDQTFDGIVVTRYLHRPLLPLLAESLAPGGVLIYETFMQGHERYGKPSNPDFLLAPDELRDVFSARLTIVAFEQGEQALPRPAVMQRLCAIYNSPQ